MATNGAGPLFDRVIRAVETVGISTVMVIILLAVLLGWLPSPITQLTGGLMRIEEKVNGAMERDYRRTSLLRLICENTSTGEAQRLECKRE